MVLPEFIATINNTNYEVHSILIKTEQLIIEFEEDTLEMFSLSDIQSLHQYTGYKDVNGNKIYEDMKVKCGNFCQGIISRYKDGFFFIDNNTNQHIALNMLFQKDDILKAVEIVE